MSAKQTKRKPAPTMFDRERRLIASMIDPATNKAAADVIEKHGVNPEMFDNDDLRDKFHQLIVQGPNGFGGYIDQESASKFSTADAATLDADAAEIVGNWKSNQDIIPLGWYADPGNDEDDADCLFKNRWLRRGGCGMLISTSGVGKSSFTMQAAAHWALGVTMLGIEPKRKLKVGIIQSEDDEYDIANFRNKIRIGLRTELGKSDAEIDDALNNRVCMCVWNGSTGSAFVEYIRDKQRKGNFDIIIVNPLHAFFGGDLKNADEVSRFLRNGIDRVIKDEQTKCALLFVHHTGKPSKEKLSEGDFFAGYLGSGSAELLNYPRIALTITPYKSGKCPGVFNLIGSKHGDKLQWRDESGKLTTKKIVCYANILERHRFDGIIYWVEPTQEELAEIESSPTKAAPKAPGRKKEGDPEEDAKVLVEKIKAGDMTRTRLREYAQAEDVFGKNRGDRAYNEVVHNLKKYGLVEKIVSGETTKIGFPDLFSGNDADGEED